ncbi:MAG TPA: radical SAM protein [Caulobacteraceae bacterium]|jgi:MoaA/NifB/PqqE/SkfB family radical SAM enzyme|nr:radical SAM protein [Caulobacteraceae bacterium]
MAGVTIGDGLKVAAHVLASRRRPLLAHLVVTRYCNLDCAYCSEYDKVSKPAPIELLLERVDALARLGTQIVTLTGGEPMSHPRHDDVIRRIRERGMIATTITNGFLLTEKKIAGMNAAGLQELQISIDGVKPDKISLKTLKSLAGRLKLLAKHAQFHVNINSVLGISEERTQDALEVARSAKALGFSHTVGVLHDEEGTLAPLSATQRAVYDALTHGASVTHFINYLMFQKNLMAGKPNAWRCRAGARYLYICEDGLVHYCSQQRGSPGIPLADYTETDIIREYETAKACAPFCTVSCVHQASILDAWRPQKKAAA